MKIFKKNPILDNKKNTITKEDNALTSLVIVFFFLSRNNYLGKEFNTNSKHIEKTRKYNKDIEILNPNGLNQTENNQFNISKKSKVKLTDKKNDVKEKNMKISDEENLEYKNRNSKKNENNKEGNGENIGGEENSKIYQSKIKELEDTINKMNSDFSKEIQTHKNEILEKEKSIKKLINSNNNLKKSLEVLTQRLDKILINANQQKPKVNKILNDPSQEELKHQLDIKEKELKNQQQLIKILTKDNKNIRKILNDFGISSENNNNINMADKIHEQYQEIQKLQNDIKELKEKNNILSQQKKDGKNLNINTDNSNKFNIKYLLNKNKKISLNSIQKPGNNLHKFNTNKSQRDLKVKKKIFSCLNQADQMVDPESIFSIEEIDILKSSFYDERRYEQFLNKISILQKATISKEKEMNMKVRVFENKLKEKEKEIKTLNEKSKEKDNKIIELNVQNKELQKVQDDLVMKIKYLATQFNQLEEKNQMILKKNEQIKNSIFSIDGIIEATSKEGEPIPLLVEVRKDSITIEKSNINKEEVKASENQ